MKFSINATHSKISTDIFKRLVLSASIVCCICVAAVAQDTQPASPVANIIDTASKPMVFADGVVTTPYTEWATSFMPDGKTVYFSRGAIYWTMCFSKLIDGKWSKPKVVNISGKWADTDPFITPDGKRIFFISNRPIEGTPQDKHQLNYHIWCADRLSGDEWSAPHRLDTGINLKGGNNFGISVSSSGDLFFCSRDREGHSGMSGYCAKWLGDHFDKPKLLALRGNDEVQDPFTAPDESYILFESGADLYIVYKNGDGWSPAQNLGKQVNNGDYNSSPCVSPDGKMLYYSTARIKGLFKPRDPKAPGISYDELLEEMNSDFNGQDNILVIPVNLGRKS
jgi:Tol biopolymer transport system component